MLSGQTQRVFGNNEKPLTPDSIRDVRLLLNGSHPRVRVRNHKIVSGIMFLEVLHTRYIERLGRMSYIRHYLVAGEDPREKGCIAAIYLSTEAQEVRTANMTGLWDTRGGRHYIAWCSAFQFLRAITAGGKDTRSVSAILLARRDYCEKLLKLLDDSIPLDRQNWQAIQKVIDDHQKLFQACRHDRHRNRPAANGGDDSDDHDDHPAPGLNRHRLADAGPSEDDDGNDRHDNHGPGPDDNGDDDDDADGHNWRNQLNRMRRKNQLDSVPRNNEDSPPDDDDIQMEGDMDGNFDSANDIMNEDPDMEDDVDETRFDYLDDRSSSPVFIPHSRQTSPETIMHLNNDRENLSEINSEDFSEIDIKLEPKVEPKEEAMAQSQYHFARPEQTHNVIDLTEDPDESTSGGSSIMEVIDLTEDSEPIRDSDRCGAVIDLTQDSDASQSPTDVIELDD